MATASSHPSFWASKLLAVFLCLIGCLNLSSTILVRPLPLWILANRYIPWEIFNISRILTVISGLGLIILARGIWMRKHRAWIMTLIVAVTSLLIHIIKKSSVIEVISLLMVLILLWYFKSEFKVRSKPLRFIGQLKVAITALFLLFCYSSLGYFLLRHEFSQPVSLPILIENYQNVLTGTGSDKLRPLSHRAQMFEGSLFTINITTVILIFAGLFAPLLQFPSQSTEMKKRVAQLQNDFGWTSISYFSLGTDKKYFFDHPNRALAYKVSNGTAVVLGEPLANSSGYANIITHFKQKMSEHGLSILFYLITSQHQSIFADLNLTLLKVGEEAVIKTDRFSLESSNLKTIRNSVSHVQKAGINFVWYRANQIPVLVQQQLNLLHERWTRNIAVPNVNFSNFSMDFYPLPADPNVIVAVALDRLQKVQAALTFLPYQQLHCLALDAMWRETQPAGSYSLNGLTEALIARSILYFQELHIQEVSLGLVALAQTQTDSVTPKIVLKGQAFLFRYFSQVYNSKSLFQFKNKFHPIWEPRYIAFANSTELPKMVLAVIGAQTKTGLGKK